MEIERKWIIENNLPIDSYCSGIYKTTQITQIYLLDWIKKFDKEVRLRREKVDGISLKYLFVTKSIKSELCREEENHPVHSSFFDYYNFITFFNFLIKKEKRKTKKIKKTRHTAFNNGYTIEIDVFNKKYANFKIVEVEFDNETEANNFIAPKWFGREVTNNPGYYNINLAK